MLALGATVAHGGGVKDDALPTEGSVLARLRALTEDAARQLMRDVQGKWMSRQYLWQLRAEPPRRKMSLRMFARAVFRLGLAVADDPLVLTLRELYPAEFKIPKRKREAVTKPAPTRPAKKPPSAKGKRAAAMQGIRAR